MELDNVVNTIEKVGLGPIIDFTAGLIAGIAGLFVGHPFDTVKVRFQTPSIAGKYHSTFHAISTIVREEKFVGLYKGILSPLATAAPLNGLIFASYRLFLKLQLDDKDTIPTLAQVGFAGAFTGIVCSLVTTPTELIKIRQQDQLIPTSTKQIALNIYKESGVPGLYRGITATILRDIGYGAYFLAYEGTCRFLNRYDSMKELSSVVPLTAGAVAGIVGWGATFPFDVVKTRMQGTVQGNTMHSSPRLGIPNTNPWQYTSVAASPINAVTFNPYRTVASTICHSFRNEGAGVFFRGLAPTLIRAIPVNMVTFATFEITVHALS